MEKLLINNELDQVAQGFKKRIKKLRKLRAGVESLQEKIHFERKVAAAEKVEHAFRKLRFDIEDEATKN